jgi:TP901 family phage tail tape measure protein
MVLLMLACLLLKFNKLAAVDVKFAVSAEDLINALARAGAVAQDAGVNFDQLVGAVTSAQQITARGGAVIGNSFKTIFTRIQRSSTLDRLRRTWSCSRDVRNNALPALQVLTNLSKSYDQLGGATKAAVAEQVGGVFQINILRAALKRLK